MVRSSIVPDYQIENINNVNSIEELSSLVAKKISEIEKKFSRKLLYKSHSHCFNSSNNTYNAIIVFSSKKSS